MRPTSFLNDYETAPRDMTQITSARLPGKGSIPTWDFETTPLGQLGIPIRFAAETIVGEQAAIMVNEKGRAWYVGRSLERRLHRFGGGEPLQNGEDVDKNERHFVDKGLKRYVDAMMPQRLGKRFEQEG
jgi:hypothetical protein